MRLVIELLGFYHGRSYGFEEYVLNLISNFVANRDVIKVDEIIIACGEDQKEFLKDYCKDKLSLFPVKYDGMISRILKSEILPDMMGLTQDDIIFYPGNYLPLRRAKTKTLLTIHDLFFRHGEFCPNTWFMRFYRLHKFIWLPQSVAKSDKIVAISQFAKDEVEHYYPKAKGKVSVIYNSMNFVKYDSDLRIDFKFNYFMAVSANVDYKNQKTILEAFKIYCQAGGNMHIVFVGTLNPNTLAGAYYSRLPDSVKNKIMLKSHITNKELGALYKGASCYISASKYEGFGMPVVEAMSFGLPVILSDIPPHREVSMGKADYFDPTDATELADKMINFNVEKREYGKDVCEMYSEKNTSIKYIELINELAERC